LPILEAEEQKSFKPLTKRLDNVKLIYYLRYESVRLQTQDGSASTIHAKYNLKSILKKKKPSRSSLVKRLDSEFSKYIRQRFAVRGKARCFTCGKIDHWKNLQCGHFQSRKHYSTRWNPQNCQVQCVKCNIFRQGEQFIFGKELDKKYGIGTAKELHLESLKTVKLSNVDLQEQIKYYKDLNKTL